MLRYLLPRTVHAVLIVAFAAMASFVLLRAAPGDAISLSVEGRGRSSAARAAVRERLGLDRPLTEQVASYAMAVLHGDLGRSTAEQRPVRDVIADALPATLLLSGAGLCLATLLGVAAGTAQGWRPHDRVASVAGALLTLLYTLPEVVVGILLLGVFGWRWAILPVGGMTDPMVALTAGRGAQLVDRALHLALPSLALALVWSASIARQQRASILEIAGEPFIRTARAAGSRPARLLWRHAMRPTLPGTVALIGTMLPALAGGTVVIESLFSWPGMGLLLVRAVATRDAPVVAGAVIVMAAVVAFGGLLTDIATGALDPRVRDGAHV